MGRHAKVRQLKYETRCKVYDFLVDFFTKNGYAPSVREICSGVGLKSTSTVYGHLLALENEGKIEMKEKVTRAIKLVGYEFVKKTKSETIQRARVRYKNQKKEKLEKIRKEERY